MAEDTPQDNRATIAQTLAEVRGLRELTRAEFASVQRQLDVVGTLPVVVARMDGELRDHKRRIKALEEARTSDHEWRRGPMLALAVGTITSVVNIAIFLVHGGHV